MALCLGHTKQLLQFSPCSAGETVNIILFSIDLHPSPFRLTQPPALQDYDQSDIDANEVAVTEYI